MVTNRNKFIDDLIDAGADDDEISEALQLAESRNEFESTQPSQPERQPEKEPNAIFPTASQVQDKGVGGIAKKAGLGALDLLGLPTRALGTVRGQKLNDPQSALLRPEIDKTTAAIDKMPEIVDKKKYHLPQMGNPMGGASSNRIPAADYREALKGSTEIVGTTLSDPLALFSLGKNIVAKPLQGTAKTIEASVLGKGNKAILKKEGKTASQMANTALKENVGGSLNKTISKIDDKLEVVENNIQDVLNTSVKQNPNLKINTDDVIERIKAKINSGQKPDLYGIEDDVIAQLDNMKSNNARYGLSGDVQVDKANQLKRLVNKKAFKKGMPDVNTAPKEMAHDLLSLELKDEIEKIVPAIGPQNAEYKKLIPIQQMAKNRRLTAQGNDMIGLKQAVSLANGNIPLAIADLLSKSGTVAQGMYNTGKGIKAIPLSKTIPLSVGGNTIKSLQNKYDTNERTKK